MLSFLRSTAAVLLFAIIGAVCGFVALDLFSGPAQLISDLFMRFLKLVSLPVICFSVMSTIVGMGNWAIIQTMGRRVVFYTIFTTLLSASIALFLSVTVNPRARVPGSEQLSLKDLPQGSYLTELLNIFPSNILQPFVEHNVIGVLIIALLFSFAFLSLDDEKRAPIQGILESIFLGVMQMIRWIVVIMPFAIWAFIVLFVKELKQGLEFQEFASYLSIVVGANLIQAFVVLPLLLRSKGISPLKAFKGMLPALSFAFFSKSSAASMPIAMDCAEKMGVSSKVSRFTFPLCTTINMNACAGFILITVLFVAQSHGIQFTAFEKGLWIFIATIAAIGNAGVPMGCFFLASALLTTMGVPLILMGVILPFYSIIDMLETTINIWSDSCVTLIVDKKTSV